MDNLEINMYFRMSSVGVSGSIRIPYVFISINDPNNNMTFQLKIPYTDEQQKINKEFIREKLINFNDKVVRLIMEKITNEGSLTLESQSDRDSLNYSHDNNIQDKKL